MVLPYWLMLIKTILKRPCNYPKTLLKCVLCFVEIQMLTINCNYIVVGQVVELQTPFSKKVRYLEGEKIIGNQ